MLLLPILIGLIKPLLAGSRNCILQSTEALIKNKREPITKFFDFISIKHS